jgi:hypothetical protein
MTNPPRSEGFSNNPKNFKGAFNKPEKILNIGIVVGRGCTKLGAFWIKRLRS